MANSQLVNTPLEQADHPMPKLTPGESVEFAKLPLGAICRFVSLRKDVELIELPAGLWIKFSPRKVVALLSKEQAAKFKTVFLECVLGKSMVQRYWIGGENHE